MHARVEERRPALVFVDDLLEDAPVPALWKDLAVSVALALLFGLAFLI
jgi:hypothetical protein